MTVKGGRVDDLQGRIRRGRLGNNRSNCCPRSVDGLTILLTCAVVVPHLKSAMLRSILRCVPVRNSTALSQWQQVHYLPKNLASSVNCRRNSRRIGCRKVLTRPSPSSSTSVGSSLLKRGVMNLRYDRSGVAGFSSSAGGAAARSSHKHTNRLAKEQSPYLLQHAHNPVDWYPWGNEAFAKARAEDKPIFLSVGYSTCHWCHVMEVESFENEQVAKLMNDMFVNIKVDREERPDVDKVYMTYVQATQGGGGWPMSVFLTPELKPIVGGTYFPPDDKYGRPGFKTVLRRVDEVWKEKKDALREAGDQVVQQLAEASTANSSSQDLPEGTAAQAVQLCASQLAKGFDPKLGGFGGPPKFPRPVEIVLMLQRYRRLEQIGNRETAASKALEMALFTLRCMARGGIHDHIGGGFHRYSVDEYWHVPHFEKMLYDQGQLVNVYLDAFAISKDAQFGLVARDVLDYLRRDMTHPDGGIFSAEDADSAESENSSKKKEGSFYVWTEQEIETVLGNSQTLAAFEVHYYVKSGGNCDLSRMSDPHDEFSGKNVLIDRKGLAKSAAKLGLPENLLEEIFGQARQDLHAYRERRPRPHLDDKVIVAWNGLAISAFARASRILKMEPQGQKYFFPVTGCDCREYLVCAQRAAEFIRTKLYSGERLCRSYRKEPSAAPGFMDDYAFLIAGLLDLYEAGGDTQWLAWALDLQTAQDDQFLDKVGGAYYSTPEGDSSILFRVKEDYDGAEPSGNSVSAINLQRLASLVGGDKVESYLRTAEHLLAVFEPRVKDVAMAVPLMCCAFDLYAGPSKRQVIIAGVKQAPDTEALVNAAHSVYDPDKIILQIDATNAQDREFWQKHNSNALAMARVSREGKAIAYVCQNFSCLAPIEDPQRLEQTLRQPPSAPKLTTFKLGTTPK